jgi:hypothetical protein
MMYIALELSSKVENSPPGVYKRGNCEQLEPVSTEEGEWTSSKKISSLKSYQSCNSSQKKVSIRETFIDKDAFDEVSSDDNLDCQSHSETKEVIDLPIGIMRTKEASARKRKRKKRGKPLKEGLLVKEILDKVSSADNICCQSHSVHKEVKDLPSGKMKTNAASFRKRIEKKILRSSAYVRLG